MLPLHHPPPPPDPTEAFFRQWGIINGTVPPIPLPTDPQEKVALSRAMFRAGKEYLREKIHAAIDRCSQPQKLIDTLRLGYNGDTLRVLRATKTAACVGTWEERLTRQIQTHTAHYAYEHTQAFPAMIAEQEKMNCLGATILMGGMLEACDIRYLQGYVTRHAILTILTADQRVVWMDPLAPHTTEEICDAHLAHARVRDIIAYSNNPSPQGLAIPIAAEHFREKVRGWAEDKQEQALLTLFPPEEGQHAMLLDTTGVALFRLQKYDVAAEALRLAVAELPGYDSAHAHLGHALLRTGEPDKARAAYEHAKNIRIMRSTPLPACRPPRPDGKTAPE